MTLRGGLVGDQTAIEWADATWSPWWGCAKVSPACTNCYAETLANRFYNGLWRGQRRRVQDWSLPAKVDRRAAREGRRLRLFVASMADVFDDHPAVAEWRREALALLAGLRNVDVLLLTKRPENVLRMVPSAWLSPEPPETEAQRRQTIGRLAGMSSGDLAAFGRGAAALRATDAAACWPRHVWVGTTVEDQQRADERIPHLLRVPARVRFLSVEPMLGLVNLSAGLFTQPPSGEPDESPEAGGLWRGPSPLGSAGLQWVIAGGESGPKARPSSLPNARALRDQCARAGVPFLWKQWGEWGPANGHDFDAGPYPAVKVDGHPMVRVGKRAAGRLLDGIEHNAFPEVPRVG